MSHGPIIVLLVVVCLIFICPNQVVVFVKLVEFLDNFAWSNLDNLFVIFIIVSSSSGFFTLAFLGLFFFAFAFGFFSTTCTIAALIISISVLIFFLNTLVESFDVFGRLSTLGGFDFLDPLTALF